MNVEIYLRLGRGDFNAWFARIEDIGYDGDDPEEYC